MVNLSEYREQIPVIIVIYVRGVPIIVEQIFSLHRLKTPHDPAEILRRGHFDSVTPFLRQLLRVFVHLLPGFRRSVRIQPRFLERALAVKQHGIRLDKGGIYVMFSLHFHHFLHVLRKVVPYFGRHVFVQRRVVPEHRFGRNFRIVHENNLRRRAVLLRRLQLLIPNVLRYNRQFDVRVLLVRLIV